VIEKLGWYTRERRIALGKRMGESCVNASDGSDRVWNSFRRPTKTVVTFLATSKSREIRVKELQAYTISAQAKHDAEVAIGIATEPVGTGRSYDVFYSGARLSSEQREEIRSLGDLFGDDESQLVP